MSVTWLFVPGDRDDRFDKAASAGADEVVVDLEDAVPAGAKDDARGRVEAWLSGPGTAWVRVNAAGTPWHDTDLATLAALPGLRGFVVPKAEDAAALAAVRLALPDGVGLVALIESALGIDQARAIATGGSVDRLAFGSIDYALDLGCDESDDALLLARSTLVLASRLGGLAPPVDGVTVATGDDAAARDAAARAAGLGFGGKLCIHPRQVGPVREGFAPTPERLAWATRVLDAVGDGEGAVVVDGEMVDRPVLLRARAIVARA